jgi:DNA polymerase III delta prime subunit
MENHHASLIFADSLESSSLPDEYKKQTTDVLHFIRERFSIDDARELSSLSLQTPLQAQKRTFILAVKDIAVEAQNALLKLFEEPPAHAQFYIVAPVTLQLLPTLRSRLRVEDSFVDAGLSNDAYSAFKKASYAERMALIAEKTKEKDRIWITQLLLGCELDYSREPLPHTDLLKALVFVRRYIDTKGASAKMLLEDIALRMPVQ